MLRKVFISMDGILTNFLYGALQRLGRLEMYNNWPPGQWSIPKVLGLNKQDYWDAIDGKDNNTSSFDFWSSLPATPNYLITCEKFEKACDEIGAELFICTNPTLNPGSITGKIVWLQRAFYPNFTQYVVTPRKRTLAAPDALLIDTSENSIQQFIKHTGKGMLYPNIDNLYMRYVYDTDIDEMVAQIKTLATDRGRIE